MFFGARLRRPNTKKDSFHWSIAAAQTHLSAHDLFRGTLPGKLPAPEYGHPNG